MIGAAFQKGRVDALARFGVKTAMMPPMAETAGLGHMMPSLGGAMKPIKRGLGLAALGAGGALMYGAHKQNQRDREGRDLINSPMSGTF